MTLVFYDISSLWAHFWEGMSILLGAKNVQVDVGVI